ncbi:hypothetical protein Kpol_1045p57 [Vanderwaltozyma polyspora DSM 70294]|uniref:HMG box domain-containing protein n=1 Tax=Vanderwaltozyma polyspora (strain ATCC 22028 / DSM 70294 / BCRC 21397 / CBS 2163 / NBRC 10782 / NRRL Y-8283 / UCD 57-17) TaxID=436907 RepID=A7TI63_VANPO|nr:uncharacterized protein Kpol_1045p57 [Vanderwaltozyma polyspora DSM 70294]EDO18070.1 hypothetical protein Kpol_1045p57 [Vanderwaltozyma polyspora DSM 70294]
MSDNDLKRNVEELKEENEVLALGIQRTRLSIKRLKLEYSVLLERLEARLEIDPELSYENPLPTLESFKKELLTKPLKKTKSKSQKAKDRDPNLPKRPTNAYLLFCEVNKEKIRQSGTQDVTKALAEAWKNLSEEDRKPYYKLYSDDRERYKREMEIYTMNNENKKEAEIKSEDKTEDIKSENPSTKEASKEDIDIDIDDDEDDDDEDDEEDEDEEAEEDDEDEAEEDEEEEEEEEDQDEDQENGTQVEEDSNAAVVAEDDDDNNDNDNDDDNDNDNDGISDEISDVPASDI